jgi:two-component system heavy metal sensor histidine kinase CusS
MPTLSRKNPIQLSLTARIALLFVAGSSSVLLALGWLIGASIEQHFEELDRDTLRSKLQQARHVVSAVSAADDLHNLPSHLSVSATGHHDLLIHITGSDQRVLMEEPSGVFSDDWKRAMEGRDETRLLLWSRGGRSFRGMSATMPTGISGAPPVKVAVAIDIAHHQLFMQIFMRTLWAFVACAALATGLLGWFAARRGLAPLKTMRVRAASVTAQKLDQRLPTDAVPTELADLAVTLNEMLARLEEAFRRLSNFSSDIAHELRTPVSNLMTQTQVSLSRPRDANAYRAILESNAEEFERLGRMISDMLFLAKSDNALAAPKLLAQSEFVDIGTEVQALFEFYEGLADDNGIQLELTGQASVIGDRLMLRRAISNLLSNALRYTPRGSNVQVQLAEAHDHVQVSIENPGETIAAHHLAHLFERFYRVDPSRNHASGEGTGLGLAITRSIVIAHQGEINATSTAGRTKFIIQLPAPLRRAGSAIPSV